MFTIMLMFGCLNLLMKIRGMNVICLVTRYTASSSVCVCVCTGRGFVGNGREESVRVCRGRGFRQTPFPNPNVYESAVLPASVFRI